MFDNNFGKCVPIFTILSVNSKENSLCIRRKDFHLTCDILLHYLVKSENPKNVTDVDSILNKLLTCFSGQFEYLI